MLVFDIKRENELVDFEEIFQHLSVDELSPLDDNIDFGDRQI